MRTVGGEISVITGRHQRRGEELPRAAAGHEVAQQLIVAGLGDARVDRPRAVSAHDRMDVLEELQIPADDEQVKLFRVDHFEVLDDLAGAWAQEREEQSDGLSGSHLGGLGAQHQAEVTRVVRSRLNERHPADGAGAGRRRRVGGMHGADPRNLLIGRLPQRRRWLGGRGLREELAAGQGPEQTDQSTAIDSAHRWGLVALPS